MAGRQLKPHYEFIKLIKKVIPNGETTVFVYDASGKMVAEYSTQLNSTPQTSYLTSDNLGSPRIRTSENGAVTARHDYHPFGEEIVTAQRTGNGYGPDEIRKKFTGYEMREWEIVPSRMFESCQCTIHQIGKGNQMRLPFPFVCQFLKNPSLRFSRI